MNNPRTPRWYATGNVAERYRRARDPECAPAQLIRLGGDDSWPVRFAVAGNPASPRTAVAALTADESPGLAKFAKTHPACPAACRGR